MTNEVNRTVNVSSNGASVNTTPLLSLMDHARFQLAMRLSQTRQVIRYKGSDRAPFQVTLDTDMSLGPVYAERCVLKPVKMHTKEGKYFTESMDLSISDAKRELLAYQIDVLCGFGLVPPVVWRDIPGYGSGSLQAWVSANTGGQWRRNFGYDYHTNTGNPWFHRLVAFDILIGNVDRHAGNWLMDKQGRIYAIDNGYSFPKRNDCRFLYPLCLKGIIGVPLTEDVKQLLKSIPVSKLTQLMKQTGFKCREESGVLRRLSYLRNLEVWQGVGRIQPE